MVNRKVSAGGKRRRMVVMECGQTYVLSVSIAPLIEIPKIVLLTPSSQVDERKNSHKEAPTLAGWSVQPPLQRSRLVRPLRLFLTLWAYRSHLHEPHTSYLI